MGFGGISPWSLLIILVIILLLFGTKRLRNMGSDLGGAFRSFKTAMKDKDEEDNTTPPAVDAKPSTDANNGRVFDVEVKQKDKV